MTTRNPSAYACERENLAVKSISHTPLMNKNHSLFSEGLNQTCTPNVKTTIKRRPGLKDITNQTPQSSIKLQQQNEWKSELKPVKHLNFLQSAVKEKSLLHQHLKKSVTAKAKQKEQSQVKPREEDDFALEYAPPKSLNEVEHKDENAIDPEVRQFVDLISKKKVFYIDLKDEDYGLMPDKWISMNSQVENDEIQTDFDVKIDFDVEL
jgi:hypothetical protein